MIHSGPPYPLISTPRQWLAVGLTGGDGVDNKEMVSAYKSAIVIIASFLAGKNLRQ